ncbi:MAG TPA: DUF11 domain-containing protein [Pyrinomonadaceae bacterium]|nr:DUF11 domain-containing protein [Pyrinomonadaceae bacterium]
MKRVRTFDNLIRRVFLCVLFTAFALVVVPQTARAQNVCGLPGNDNVATLSGVINTYYPGAGTASANALSIQVGAARIDGAAVPITSGDLLLVIQMQDATINATNTTAYGANNGTQRGATNINGSGLYEYVVATSSIGLGANTVSIRGTSGTGGLRNTYTNASATTTQGQRKFQVIRVPQYASATLTSGLTAAPWDHVTATGGVLAFDVAGQLTLGGATVSVNGRGFRGGGGRPLVGGRVNNVRINQNLFDYTYPTSSPLTSTVGAHGTKGEGIAGTPRYVYDRATDTVIENSAEGYPGGSNARGAPGNAGGGGTDSAGDTNNEANSGGGGGSNGGIGGGGGNTWRDNNAIGGIGGAAVANDATRVVMGGGGGAGSRNNSVDTDSSGGAGGGIVLIRTDTISGTGIITANGDDAPNDTANDGGGGGGAGGSVIVTASGSLTGLTIRAWGGRGGNAWRTGGTSLADRHGPGGGGAGGFIAYTAGASPSVTGGTNGLTTTLADSYGATPGGAGTTLPIVQTDIPGIRSGAQCVPVLTVTKATSTAAVTNTTTGTTATYTITVSNAANRVAATSVVLSDLLPTGFTYKSSGTVTLTNGATRPSTTNPTVGATNPAWSSFTIPATGQVALTFTVDIASSVTSGTYQNPATATYFDPARTVANGTTFASYNSASSTNEDVTVTSRPDLTVAKSHTGNFTLGSTGIYSITVNNLGPAATTGATVTVTDTLPAGLTVASVSAPSGWNCSGTVIGSGTATCTSTNVVAAGQSFPVISLTVNVATNAAASVTNSVSVAGGGETNVANNTATDATVIDRVPDVRIAKSHTGSFTVGVNGSYTLTASNAGGAATSGTITVVDNLPAGLTVAAIPVIPNWNCSTTVVGSSTLTCTSATSIPAASNHPNAITLSVVVSAAAFAASPVTNVANISGGGEPAFNNTNNSASDPTTIIGSPDLTITKTHTGNFTRGATTDAYTITVTNSGTAATDGTTVTVIDTLPAGLTIAAPIPSGTGWNCSTTVVGGSTATCTRTTVLNPGVSYPLITVRVAVSQTAANSVTNSVTVSGGGEPASLNTDNTATDPTNIISRADLSLTKTANNAAPLINQLVTFTLTVTNAGPTNTTGVTVRDLLPAGLSFVSATPAAAYNNTTGIWTVGNLNSGSNSTLQIVARVTTSGAITNTAEVNASAITDPDSTPNNNVAAEDDQASVLLGVPVPPDVRLQKRCTAPVNCESAAQLPGAELTYTITFTNTAGTSAAQGLTIIDIIPITDTGTSIVRNTEFKVGSMTFSPGTSTLSIAPTDYKYYNDPLSVYPLLPPWTPTAAYTPSGAFDYAVTYVGWKLTGTMPPGTSGSVSFTVRIR